MRIPRRSIQLMQWTTLTVSALNDAKAAPLITAVRTTCLASGQSDPTTSLLQNVANQIRSAIGFSGKYMISATVYAVPPNLQDMAINRVVRLCKRRLEQPLTPDERDEETEFQKTIERLTRGEWPVDVPDDPISANPSTPAASRVSLLPNTNVGDAANTARPFARNMTGNL